MIFEQGAADSAAHSLFIDEVRIDNAPAAGDSRQSAQAAIKNLQAHGYERHIDLTWDLTRNAPASHSENEAASGRFIVYRSFDGSNFQPMRSIANRLPRGSPPQQRTA
jgi:hypothetical protein